MAKSIGDRVLEQSVLMIARELTRDVAKKVIPKLKDVIAKISGTSATPTKVSKYDTEESVE